MPAVREDTKTFQATGVLGRLEPGRRHATISHEPIEGYMPAMTMDFAVANWDEIASFEPGDVLEFHLCVRAESAWIEHVRKIGSAAPPAVLPAFASDTRELRPGDRLPEISLVDQRGRTIGLALFRGQVLAITFIYTRCPLPTYCPFLNHRFQDAQAMLRRLGLEASGRFLSVSLDAIHDTTEVLAAFAENYGADVSTWTFASANDHALRELGDSIGLEFRMIDGRVDHNLRTVVLDRTGRISRIFRGNTWTTQELVAAMRSANSEGAESKDAASAPASVVTAGTDEPMPQSMPAVPAKNLH
jgi:protein SCO1/2